MENFIEKLAGGFEDTYANEKKKPSYRLCVSHLDTLLNLKLEDTTLLDIDKFLQKTISADSLVNILHGHDRLTALANCLEYTITTERKLQSM